jgi:predicted dehydrogenase
MTKVAVLGCGYWGPNLVRNFVQLLGPEGVVCYDTDPARLALAAERHPGVGLAADLEDVLADVSVTGVCLCTPAATHYAITRKCLDHGKHVLVEKPLALDPAEAQALTSLAKERGLALMVGHVFLYSPSVRRLRDLVQQGELGDIRYIYSIRASLGPRVREDVNVVWDYLIHDAYIVPYVLGRGPSQVRASGGAYLRAGLTDVVFATLYWDDGLVANCTASWYDPVKTRRMVVVGSSRMAIYDEEAPHKLTIYNRGYAPHEGCDKFGNRDLRLYDDGYYYPELDMAEPLRLECQSFLAAMQEGAVGDTMDGVEVVRLLEAVDRSLRAGGEAVVV